MQIKSYNLVDMEALQQARTKWPNDDNLSSHYHQYNRGVWCMVNTVFKTLKQSIKYSMTTITGFSVNKHQDPIIYFETNVKFEK